MIKDFYLQLMVSLTLNRLPKKKKKILKNSFSEQTEILFLYAIDWDAKERTFRLSRCSIASHQCCVRLRLCVNGYGYRYRVYMGV